MTNLRPYQPITLRPYQKKAVQDLWAWFERNPTGDPCLVLSTGAGKSIIIAEICKEALQYPDIRILKVTHTKGNYKTKCCKAKGSMAQCAAGDIFRRFEKQGHRSSYVCRIAVNH